MLPELLVLLKLLVLLELIVLIELLDLLGLLDFGRDSRTRFVPFGLSDGLTASQCTDQRILNRQGCLPMVLQ